VRAEEREVNHGANGCASALFHGGNDRMDIRGRDKYEGLIRRRPNSKRRALGRGGDSPNV